LLKEPGLYREMIDNLSILLSHVLIAIAFWYLTKRDDLDLESPPAPDAEPEGFASQLRNRKRPAPQDKAAGDA
jgi:hypothetical protein